MVACGAAGGIAATFNAPIAGAVFAMEIIAGQVQAASFGAMVISAVLADVVARFFTGDMRAFMVPDYYMVSSWELVFYAALGICAAVAAALFTTILYWGEDLVEKIILPEYVKPVIGGLCLGLLGLTTLHGGGMPHIFGVGYETINLALGNELLYTTALAFLAAKMLATVMTLGFGGSGGVFAPSLFMGAMLGEAFGIVVHHFFPAITAPPGAYSLVGMAAFFSGAAHAPITAILMLFEMTGNYHIILPLMLATVISNILSAFINPESIYIRKLTRRGVYLRPGHEIDLMLEITVAEAMTHDPLVVSAKMTLGALADKFSSSHHHSFIVVDDEGLLVGMVSLRDLEQAMVDNSLPDNKRVEEIATTDNLLVAYPHESMGKALQIMGQENIGRLPVIARRGSREIIGVIRRHEIIQVYNKAILKRARGRKNRSQPSGDLEKNMRFAYIHINKSSPALNARVKDLDLPREGLLVAVDHGRHLSVAHGDTVLRLGDRVTILADDDSLPVFRRLLQG
jgi:CIC family chloride channel protein